jgi:two-component sensor histidine kinase
VTENGTGTYRLAVRLPPGRRDLALRISTVWAAWELEANGVVLARGGLPSLEQAREVPTLEGRIVPLPGLGPEENLELLVRVSNHQYRWGGMLEAPVLGPLTTLVAGKRHEEMVGFLLIGALGGTVIWALFLFGFRRQDRAYLSFAIFAALTGLRALTSAGNLLTEVFPGMPFDLFVRLSYLSLYLLIPVAAVFFAQVFREDITRREIRIFLALAALPVPLVFLPSVLAVTWTLLGFLPLALGLVFYGYWVVALRTSLRRRPGAGILLVAGSILLGLVVMNLRNEVVLSKAETAFPLGLIAFVIAQALLLAKRSTWAFGEIETLTGELKAANRSLAREARDAEEARAEVETILAEKEVLLREVHHRVKNSLQIVLSIIGLQVRRTKEPAVLEAYQGVRDRIRAISLVHDRLYGMDSEQNFDLKSYLADLTAQLGGGYTRNQMEFLIASEAPLLLPMDFCLEVGLVVTELVINACRHGVPPGSPGQIRVKLETPTPETLALQVADTGPGFPPGFAPEASRSAGYKIMASLVSNRKGHFRIGPGPGATIDVEFPLPR